MGLAEEHYKARGLKYKGWKTSARVKGKAQILNGDEGLVKTIATIHSHPTVTKTIQEVTFQAEKQAIHTKN